MLNTIKEAQIYQFGTQPHFVIFIVIGRLLNIFIMAKKSKACSKVLKLMDKDYSYQKALKEVLKNDKRLSKKKLEKELNTYI